MMYSKTRHIKVKGNADINHVVRVDFYLHNGKDSLVKYVEEVEFKTKKNKAPQAHKKKLACKNAR